VGIHDGTHRLFASNHLVEHSVGHSTLWEMGWWSSPNEPDHPLHQRGIGVFAFLADDRGSVAEWVCGGDICDTSATCGIGGVGSGTQRCVKRVIFSADATWVCELRGEARSGAISGGGGIVYPWDSIQTDVGDSAVCIVAAGLLAVAANELHRGQGGGRATGVGKGAVRRRGGAVESPDFYYSKADRSGSRGSTFCSGAPIGERGRELWDVHMEHDLAAELGVVLSLPNDDRDGGRVAFGSRASVGFDFLHREEAIVALFDRRLVVVRGNVGASDRFYPSRETSAGGSLYLSATNWFMPFGRLGCGRAAALAW